MQAEFPQSSINAIHKLLNVVALLRDPVKGCPWDREQTNLSLIPYLLEEAHEVADAIRNGSDQNIVDELGDLLLQILLHAQIGKENKRFDIESITISLTDKLIRRHPHVFNNLKLTTTEEVREVWEQVKLIEEPQKKSTSPISDRLKNKARSQSALAGAMIISKKAASSGFEWQNIDEVFDKVNEELYELHEAIRKKNKKNVEEELGDLLFTLVNVARWHQISPEEGLVGANNRFLDRFAHMESAVKGEFTKKSKSELRELWSNAKYSLQKKDSQSNIKADNL